LKNSTGSKTSGDRRSALKTLGAGVLVAPSVALSAGKFSLAPAAFDADSGSVMLWACATETLRAKIQWRALAPGGEPSATPSSAEWLPGPEVVFGAESDFTQSVMLTGLPENRSIEYRWLDVTTTQPLAEPGRFKTASSQARKIRFVFSADLQAENKPFSLFDDMSAAQPDFALILGDTIYADVPKRDFSGTERGYRRKHFENRSDGAMQKFLSQHVCYATWDDHETDNNCDSTHRSMPAAQKVFREYWPCRSVNAEGLHRRFNWGACDFFMLDTRSFRSPNRQGDGLDKTILGTAQKAWLKDGLKQSKAAYKFVITSVPFQGGGEDTWGAFKAERQEIEAHLRSEQIAGVVFLTGDYHLARDWSREKAGYREFMAGPIASFLHYQRTPSARDRYEKAGSFHYGDGYNFGLIEVDPSSGKGWIEWRGLKGVVLGRVEI
jgi:alkaline phosphatase D